MNAFYFLFFSFNAVNLIYESNFLYIGPCYLVTCTCIANLFYSVTTETGPLGGEFTDQYIT